MNFILSIIIMYAGDFLGIDSSILALIVIVVFFYPLTKAIEDKMNEQQ